MTSSSPHALGTSRQRERDIMAIIARVIAGCEVLRGTESTEELRQLGYAAHLASDLVEEGRKPLRALASYCWTIVCSVPRGPFTYRDIVQARWGARYHLEAGKLRTELPIHVRNLEYTTDHGSPSGPARSS